jgi:hypothetical protein
MACDDPECPPAYITVSQFEANESKLAANRARAEAMGATRGGPALAAGLVHCGRCNRRMTVNYHIQHSKALPEYVCARDVTNYGAKTSCQLLNSACVDAFVEQKVSRHWRRPPSRCPCARPTSSWPSGPSWNNCGRSGWNAPHRTPTGPAAATTSPNRRRGLPACEERQADLRSHRPRPDAPPGLPRRPCPPAPPRTTRRPSFGWLLLCAAARATGTGPERTASTCALVVARSLECQES